MTLLFAGEVINAMRFRSSVMLVVFLIGAGSSLSADTAAITMRPDEAFWNAVRESDDPVALDLFVQTNPQSPYLAQAKARIDLLKSRTASESVYAPDAEIELTSNATPEQTDPIPVPSLPDLLAALKSLNANDTDPSVAPDPKRVVEYLNTYRTLSGRDALVDSSDAELREVMFFAKYRNAFFDIGFDSYIIRSVRERMSQVYEIIYKQPPPEDITVLVKALQRALGLQESGELTKEFLVFLTSTPVTLSAKVDDSVKENFQFFDDWVYVGKGIMGNGSCAIFPRTDRLKWQGPLLITFVQTILKFSNSGGQNNYLIASWATGDLFMEDKDVKLVSGRKKLPLAFYADENPNSPLWMSTFNETQISGGVGLSGALLKMLKNAAGDVQIEGTSRLGYPLAITVSSKGFTKAFRTMSNECSGGAFDIWIR